MSLTADNALFGHTDEASALVVDDYPYGFKLRTQIRYWLQTTKNGDRLVSQTLNPKTGRWNKPKASTYVEVGVMYRNDENGHIEWAGIGMHSKDEAIAEFQAVTEGKLSPAQLKQLGLVIGVSRAFKHVTYKLTGSQTDEERAAQAETNRKVNRMIGYEVNKATQELTGD